MESQVQEPLLTYRCHSLTHSKMAELLLYVELRGELFTVLVPRGFHTGMSLRVEWRRPVLAC